MPVAKRKGMSVADNLARIKETIGDRPVKLIAVTKTAKPAQIEEAYPQVSPNLVKAEFKMY